VVLRVLLSHAAQADDQAAVLMLRLKRATCGMECYLVSALGAQLGESLRFGGHSSQSNQTSVSVSWRMPRDKLSTWCAQLVAACGLSSNITATHVLWRCSGNVYVCFLNHGHTASHKSVCLLGLTGKVQSWDCVGFEIMAGLTKCRESTMCCLELMCGRPCCRCRAMTTAVPRLWAA
jgi:hypothetical protein